MSALPDVKALTFDVFGTVVDWRGSVTAELSSRAAAKLASGTLDPAAAQNLAAVGWAAFAQEWRDSYKHFTAGYDPAVSAWKDIDAHHRDSLVALLAAHGLEGVYTASEAQELSLAWHRLRPWEDSAPGLKRLGAGFVTSTLSNGNRSLLEDLDAFGNLGFRRILSAEDWKAYKPSSVVYDGAVRELLGEGGPDKRAQVAMVAAHLGDLAAARTRGLRTVYVERRDEEDWEREGEKWREARTWVDVWVAEGEGGFEEVARRLGV
ncbi:(S)-2-haloacid dehalogenase [Colletotrichum spinosum]|uniref:(S)-2-haloacid dehalogenase n=1 Tax=Colletotrichum spinosum TaxID=1347390 RepID=A0A4R8PLQ0_9PEZI|nr:(S)-2-haloacid dehalogenase [Colletotrichum spinosum]